MKCKNNVDGGICGEEIPQSSKFCLACGGKVAKEDDTTTKACPQCSSLITKRQKFCSGCGWRIDPAIFLAPKILCAGKDDDGNTCGAELIPGVKFCPECGNDQSKLNEQDKVAKGDSESVPVERQTEDSPRVDDLTNTRRSPQQSSGSGSSSRSDSPDAWKPPGMLSSTPDSTEEDTGDSDLQRVAGAPQNEPEVSERFEENKMVGLNDEGQGDTVKNDENTKDTGSQLPASAINEPSKSPVNDLDKIHQQSEAMETDETPKSDNTMEDNNMNDQSTQPECQPQGPSLSESGNPVTSDEPMEIPVTESGLTKTDTNKTEKTVTTPSVNEEIPPHSFITNSTGNAGAKNKVQQLAQTFEKNVNVRSPEKVKTQDAGSEQEQDQDVRNGNVPPESVVSENVDETGDAKPQTPEDKKDWKNAPLPDSSSSDDDGDEEEDADKEDKGEGEEEDTKPDPSVKSKHKKKGKKRRKLEEEKKKDRKKRKEEKSKGETDGTSDISKKQDKKEKKAKTQSKEEKDEEMKQLAANEETRVGDKDRKNQTNKSSVAEKIQKSTETASTSTQASGQSYASVTANNATTGKGSNQKGKQFVDIYFHCIVAANLISSFERDKLFVVFEDTTLGGWKARKYQMKGLRVLKDDSVEFSGVVAMPKGQVYRRQNYNYVITHGQTETWEYVYYSGGLSGNSLYRTLNIYGKDLKKGVYHRYDGVVRDNPTKNKGLLQQFKEFFIGDEYKKILYRDAEHASLTFLPHWQLTSLSADGINGEEIVNHVNFVVDGLRETYCKLAGLWHGSDFDKVVATILQPSLLRILVVLRNREGLENEAKLLNLVTGITIAYLSTEYNINLENWGTNVLCEVLLPLIDFQKQHPYNLEGLQSFFPNTMKLAAEGVLNLSRRIAASSSNPLWTYCIPVIHFLQGKCIPFEQTPTKVNHNDVRPEWWGIVEYKLDIDYFKAKSVPWECSPAMVLKALNPYFTMDYLLPRSFMTALKLEQIPDIVKSGCFQSDIILAAISYYAKMTSTSWTIETRDKILTELFKQVIIQNTADETKAISFIDAWRSLKISADIVRENYRFKYGTKPTRMIMMEAFLVTLDLYDKTQTDADFKRKEIKDKKISKEDHMAFFAEFRFDFCDWMSKAPFYKEELAYLERWNAALKFNIPKGPIRDEYFKHVEEHFQLEMQLKGSDDELVKIYLLHNEAFESAVQAILSEVALKAIQNCRNFDMKIMSEDRVVMRFGDLINNVLERNWDQSQNRNPHQTLEHAITWAPFPTFIEMYYKFSKHLKSDCLKLLDESIKILKNTVAQLLCGSIMIKDLQIILEKRENFQKVVQSMKDEKVNVAMLTLNLREKEFQTYAKVLKTVKEFLNYSIHCKADTLEMEKNIRDLENIGTYPLNFLVKTMSFDEIADLEKHRPFVKIFELGQDQLDVLPDIVKCSIGLLFTKLWEERGIELKKN